MASKSCCFICNTHSAVYLKNCKRMFRDFTTLQPEKPLSSVVEAILETPIIEPELVSDKLCIKCYSLVLEYDLFNTKIANLKKSLQSYFKKSSLIRNGTIQVSELTPNNILPAFELQPLPTNFIQLLENLSNSALSSQKSMPVITSVTSLMKTSTEINVQNITDSVTNAGKDMPNTSYNIKIEDFPQDSLSSPVLAKIENTDSNESIDDRNDEIKIEINEDCAVSVDMPLKNESAKVTNEEDRSDNEHNYVALNVVTGRDEKNNELIFRELQIMNEDGEQKNTHSNDGSQSDIRVPGDEKTATATIAAAQKQEIAKTFQAEAEKYLKSEQASRQYICAICDLVLTKRSEYNKHLNEHSAWKDQPKHFECDVCNKKFISKSVIRDHMTSHVVVKPYSCSECKKKFSSERWLQVHMRMHQDRPRTFKCEQCGKAFFNISNLSCHKKTHSGIKGFVCRICGKAFRRQYNLENHIVVHSGCEPYSCAVCKKAFAGRTQLTMHARVHTAKRGRM